MIRDTLKRLSKIASTYPARGADIFAYAEELTSRPGPHPIAHIASPANTPATISDLGLVICNFGDSKSRRLANHKALQWTLVSKPKPYIVLVDAQHDGDEHYYTKYADDRVFVLNKTIPDEAKGMFIKEALWNIGAKYLMEQNLGITKLVFLDMDVEFLDQMWAAEVSESLDKYDCISPHVANYYAEDDGSLIRGLRASVGYNQTLSPKKPGFQGMSFGCTVDFYVNRLNSEIKLLTSGSGDTYLWYSIAGNTAIPMGPASLVHKFSPSIDASGMLPSPKIGHSSQIIAHRDHGGKDTRGYSQRMALLKRCNYGNFDDYTYNEDNMPVWADNDQGKLMSAILPKVMARVSDNNPYHRHEVMELYEQEAVDIYGAITPSYPLIVTCLLRSGGGFDGRHVRWLKQQFDEKCLTPFTFICQSDIKIDGITTIPLELTSEQAPGCSSQIEQYRNIWPENASVLTCDLDTVLYRPFLPHRCPENRFFMLREFDTWTRGKFSLWGGGLTYFRGDFSFLVDTYMRHISGSHVQKPRYMHTGAQEFLAMALRLNGHKPESIEPHFCCRYWDSRIKTVQPETSILAFPGDPKPWDLKGYSFIPELPNK